jgi:hypothetical protein
MSQTLEFTPESKSLNSSNDSNRCDLFDGTSKNIQDEFLPLAFLDKRKNSPRFKPLDMSL